MSERESLAQSLKDATERGAAAARCGDASPNIALDGLKTLAEWTPAHTFYFKLGFFAQLIDLKRKKAKND